MKKISVPTPLISTATLASTPINSAPSTGPPNIATTCWMPSAIVCGQGSRSSGATTMPSAGCFIVQENTSHPNLPRFAGGGEKSVHHHLAVEMPGGMAEDRQDDGEATQKRNRADDEARGDDQSPGCHWPRIRAHGFHRCRHGAIDADIA